MAVAGTNARVGESEVYTVMCDFELSGLIKVTREKGTATWQYQPNNTCKGRKVLWAGELNCPHRGSGLAQQLKVLMSGIDMALEQTSVKNLAKAS
jgi:hypothetical protein